MTGELIPWRMTPLTRELIVAALGEAARNKLDLNSVCPAAGCEPCGYRAEVAAEYERVAAVVSKAGQAEPDAESGRSHGPGLTGPQRLVLAAVISDAVEYRTRDGYCADCESSGGTCVDHAADLDKTDAYLNLGRDLGADQEGAEAWVSSGPYELYEASVREGRDTAEPEEYDRGPEMDDHGGASPSTGMRGQMSRRRAGRRDSERRPAGHRGPRTAAGKCSCRRSAPSLPARVQPR